MYCSWRRGEFEISTDPARIDLAVVHGFLTNSYWAKGIPLETVARSIRNSICFGVYRLPPAGDTANKALVQAGFARIITDRATFSYIADVFILESFRGQGLSRWLMECIMSHPEVQGLRRWSLITADAHGLYTKFGFVPVKAPERWMELHDPGIYGKS